MLHSAPGAHRARAAEPVPGAERLDAPLDAFPRLCGQGYRATDLAVAWPVADTLSSHVLPPAPPITIRAHCWGRNLRAASSGLDSLHQAVPPAAASLRPGPGSVLLPRAFKTGTWLPDSFVLRASWGHGHIQGLP